MSLVSVFALYLALGALAGTLAGLFGIGGGLVIVPALIFIFGLQGISPDIAPAQKRNRQGTTAYAKNGRRPANTSASHAKARWARYTTAGLRLESGEHFQGDNDHKPADNHFELGAAQEGGGPGARHGPHHDPGRHGAKQVPSYGIV